MATAPVSWRNLPGAQNNWAIRTVGGGLSLLMQWGTIQFMAQPLNFNELDHETETDWAIKEIAGAAIYREWVGENDEVIHLRGKLFPYRIGGWDQMESFDAQRRSGAANILQRGDGTTLGWFVCQKLIRSHTFISFEGLGQQVSFETVMVRVPVPAGQTYLSQLWQAGALGTE